MHPEEGPPERPDAGAWKVVQSVADGLHGQYALLFGLGMAVLLVLAGALAIEKLQTIAIALVAIDVLALASWMATRGTYERGGHRRIQAGGARVGPFSRLNRSTVSGGSVRTTGVAGDDVRAGSGEAGLGSQLDRSRVEGGGVIQGPTDKF